ncbi:MAG: sigma-70 family RNA polymerase sigma factor [Gemmatimonadetes bacterium]|nr:sigma-70 family RNA polymerase sigma factor [Gemmatimonadota bacterium]
MTSQAARAETLDLNELIAPVLPVAYRVALNLTRDPHEAEDVVQEAALNACRGFGGFEAGTNFKAWFLRIVTNAFISRYRRRSRSNATMSIDELERPDDLDLAASAFGEPEPDPLTRFVSNIETDEILAALDRLPVEYRTVAMLYFVDDMSYQDIAAAVGCPVGTVRSRLHRSREHLKRSLRHLAEERGFGRALAGVAGVA